MDKLTNLERELSSPGLEGPDYFSIVIETVVEESAAPSDELEDATTDKLYEEWDAVDEASDESFPASDPPAWSGAHAAPTFASARMTEPSIQAVEPPVRPVEPRTRLRKFLVAALALGTLVAVMTWFRRQRLRA